jgi:hypothetical protein
MQYNVYRLRTPNNLHSPSATAVKVTAVLSSNHVYLLRTVLYWLKPPYRIARVSVTNVKLCHDLPSGLSWNGRVKLSNKQTHTDVILTVWDLIRCCWDKRSWWSEGQWHLHLPGSSKFLDCLTLEVTTLQHHVTSHKTWIHSTILLWEKALTHPQCLCYHLTCTCQTLVSSKLNTLNSLHRFIQILNKSVTNTTVYLEHAWLMQLRCNILPLRYKSGRPIQVQGNSKRVWHFHMFILTWTVHLQWCNMHHPSENYPYIYIYIEREREREKHH